MPWSLLLASLLVAACAELGPSGPPALTIAIDSTAVWQHGMLAVRSSAFRQPGADTAAWLLLDGDSTTFWTVLRLNDVTLQFGVDSRQPGVHQAAVVMGGPPSNAIPIHVYGAAWPYPQGPAILGGAIAPTPYSTRVLALTQQGLVEFDVRSPSVPPTLLDSAVAAECLGGFGPSVATGAVVVSLRTSTGCGPLRARVYDGAGAVQEIDSGPPSVGGKPAAHVGPGRWLVVGDGEVRFAVRQADGSFTATSWPAPEHMPVRFMLSPRGDRAVPVPWYASQPNAPVFDLATGGAAYVIPPRLFAAAFSSGGDSLFVIEEDSLVVLDATTGTRLAAVSSGGYRTHIVLDVERPYLYLMTGAGDFSYTVIDRRTWAIVGAINAAGENYFDVVPILSPSDRRLWAVLEPEYDYPVPAQLYIAELTLRP